MNFVITSYLLTFRHQFGFNAFWIAAGLILSLRPASGHRFLWRTSVKRPTQSLTIAVGLRRLASRFETCGQSCLHKSTLLTPKREPFLPSSLFTRRDHSPFNVRQSLQCLIPRAVARLRENPERIAEDDGIRRTLAKMYCQRVNRLVPHRTISRTRKSSKTRNLCRSPKKLLRKAGRFHGNPMTAMRRLSRGKFTLRSSRR